MKKILAEFKEFINRGSVVDLAVGIMIGGAFQAIVNSLVNDIISPLIGLLVQKDFSDLSFNIKFPVLGEGLDGLDEFLVVPIKYGAFIMAILNFLIIALVLFFLIRGMNRLQNIKRRKNNGEPAEAEAAPTTKICPYCKSEIAIDAVKCPHCTSDLKE